MRNLSKEPRPIKVMPVEKPTPNQSLGWRRGELARLMILAGVFDTKARIRLMAMDKEAVELQIEYYQKKQDQSPKAA